MGPECLLKSSILIAVPRARATPGYAHAWAGTLGELPSDKPPCQALPHQGMLYVAILRG